MVAGGERPSNDLRQQEEGAVLILFDAEMLSETNQNSGRSITALPGHRL
jgi:hypothetical protein